MNIVVRPQTVNVAIGGSSVSVSTDTPIVKEYIERPSYEGEYTVTPSQETQILHTKWLKMDDNVTVNQIPSNYGLITYNGSILTIS